MATASWKRERMASFWHALQGGARQSSAQALNPAPRAASSPPARLPPGCRPRQHRLARAGRARDQEQDPLPGACPAESFTQPLKLALTLTRTPAYRAAQPGEAPQAGAAAGAKQGGKPWGILPCPGDRASQTMAR
jgi:hypothetical protein